MHPLRSRCCSCVRDSMASNPSSVIPMHPLRSRCCRERKRSDSADGKLVIAWQPDRRRCCSLCRWANSSNPFFVICLQSARSRCCRFPIFFSACKLSSVMVHPIRLRYSSGSFSSSFLIFCFSRFSTSACTPLSLMFTHPPRSRCCSL